LRILRFDQLDVFGIVLGRRGAVDGSE